MNFSHPYTVSMWTALVLHFHSNEMTQYSISQSREWYQDSASPVMHGREFKQVSLSEFMSMTSCVNTLCCFSFNREMMKWCVHRFIRSDCSLPVKTPIWVTFILRCTEDTFCQIVLLSQLGRARAEWEASRRMMSLVRPLARVVISDSCKSRSHQIRLQSSSRSEREAVTAAATLQLHWKVNEL